MPTRYYFDLENGGEAIRDDEGIAADDPEYAIEQAILGIREMRIGGELGDSVANWELVIRDDAGSELKRIPL